MDPVVEVAVIAAVPSTLVACGGLLLGWLNRAKLTEIHVDINSRITQLLQATSDSSYKSGRADEKQESGEAR